MQGNDNKDSDVYKKSFPKIKSRGIPIITAVCVTAVLTAAAAAFFINRFGDENNEPVQFYYSSQVTVYTTLSVPAETRSSSKGTIYSSATKKTVSATVPAETSSGTETQTQTEVRTEMIYSFPADINLVTAEQLMQIDGIGEVTAQKILDYRSGVGVIRNMDMLLEIDGIGEATLDKLKGYLYVSEGDYAEMTTSAEETGEERTEKVTTEIPSAAAESAASTTAETSTRTSAAETTTAAPRMKKVNINTAGAQELSECLLIDIGLAEDIVELRTNIQYFVNDLELLYVDGFSKEMLVERRPYITL